MPLMRLGPMLMTGGMMMPGMGPRVRGHANALMKDFDSGWRGTDFHLLLRELVGNAVPMVVPLDVVIDVDARRFPLAILVTLSRQRLQRRPVQSFKQRSARAFPLAKG